MLGWSRWMNYIDPIVRRCPPPTLSLALTTLTLILAQGYGFEALMVNEFHGRIFPCAAFVPAGPGYEGATGLDRVCSTVGSVPGSNFVNGDDYINTSYDYYVGHKWRNVGIIIVCELAPTSISMSAWLTENPFHHSHRRFPVHLPRRLRVHLGRQEQGRDPPLPARSQEVQTLGRPRGERHQDRFAGSQGRQHDPASNCHLPVGGRRLRVSSSRLGAPSAHAADPSATPQYQDQG